MLKDNESPFSRIIVVMLCEDFYQIPPVNKHFLYWKPYVNEDSDNGTDVRVTAETEEMEEMKGLKLWHQFDKVFLLTEQMWQAEDVEYRDMLRHARAGKLTEKDYDQLTSKITNRVEFGIGSLKIVTRSNAIRHQLNLMGVLGFAAKTNKLVYLFIADDKKYPEVSRSELFSIGDKSSNLPSSGIFLFIKGIPIIINSNCHTALGIVNRKEK